jgi:hypothetical protein
LLAILPRFENRGPEPLLESLNERIIERLRFRRRFLGRRSRFRRNCSPGWRGRLRRWRSSGCCRSWRRSGGFRRRGGGWHCGLGRNAGGLCGFGGSLLRLGFSRRARGIFGRMWNSADIGRASFFCGDATRLGIRRHNILRHTGFSVFRAGVFLGSAACRLVFLSGRAGRSRLWRLLFLWVVRHVFELIRLQSAHRPITRTQTAAENSERCF